MKTIYIIKIHQCDTFAPQELKILYDLLAVPHCSNLLVIYMLKASETKVTKKLNSNEYLIFYHSDIPLPSIDTKIVSVFNSNDDPKKFQQYNKDEFYITIGIKRIKMLSMAESRYLIQLLNRIPELVNTTNPIRKRV